MPITDTQLKLITEQAERLYPINGTQSVSFQTCQSCKRSAYISAVTAEREKAKVLVEGLEKISMQHTCKDMIANGQDDFGDIEFGYDSIIEEARKTLDTYNKTINNG